MILWILHRLPYHRLLIAARDIIQRQQDLIADQEHKILAQQAELDQLKLEHTRGFRNVLSAFLDIIDSPTELDRETIEAGLQDLNDQVARLEEHTLTR